MNDKKCGDCVFYDPQTIQPNGQPRPTGHGWCAIRSKYSKQKEAGQGYVNPPDCAVTDGELAQPVIVYENRVEADCLRFTSKT